PGGRSLSTPGYTAYRRGKSCDTAVGQLESSIREAWRQGFSVGALFVDIEGAFDKCSTWSSLQVLLDKGLGPDYLALLGDYLSDRTITVHHGTDSCTRRLTRGIAQGGVTSPWVFNAFMLTFDAALSSWVTVIYADDGVILFRYVEEPHVQTAVDAITSQLDKWCRHVKCRLSWPKTRLMCFPVADSTITEGCVKWLGIQFDRKFKWSQHVASLIGKTEASYHSIKRPVCSTWGLIADVALQFFDTVARGHLLHGCAKQRLTFPEFLDAEPVKEIVGGAVHPYPVERFVEVTERISYTTVRYGLPDSGTAVIYSDGSVLPGQWAGCGIAFATITGDWAEILGIWLAASTGASQPHVARVVVLSDCMRAIDTLTGRNGSLTA
ncbi:hypothetical protein FOZ62_007525, partial [Perkinsus olseni]